MRSRYFLSRLLVLVFASWLGFSPPAFSPAPAFASQIPALPTPQSIPENTASHPNEADLPSGWWEQVSSDLAASEYQISWVEETYLPGVASAYQSPNRRQDLRLYYTPDGVTVIPRRFDKGVLPWQWSVELTGWGSDLPLPSASLSVSDNRVDYQRSGPDAGLVTSPVESFTNTAEGVVHGFTLSAPQSVETSLMRLELAVTGDLSAEWPSEADAAAEKPTGLEFRTQEEAGGLRCGGLQAFDALGTPLPAWLEPVEGGFAVLIDAAAAQFPVQAALRITSISAAPDWDFAGDQADSMFGFQVAGAGDVNCDSYSDVIVGAPYYDGGAAESGKAFLFYGSVSGLQTEIGWGRTYSTMNAHLGLAVAAAGDVNADGCGDVLLGMPDIDWGEKTDSGQAVLFHGVATGSLTEYTFLNFDDQANAHFGASLAFAGDVNGDGFSDVIVGAPGYTHDHHEEGRAYVFYGYVLGIADVAAWQAEADQQLAHLGSSVSTAGDVNGDGYADILVGSEGYDDGAAEEGAAFIWYGMDGIVNGAVDGTPGNADWYRDSESASAFFGASVSPAGDINGDGFADVVIGSPQYTNGQSSEGAAWVFLGSGGGVSMTADIVYEGGQTLAQLGRSVFTAGDVNGDGYADVVAGAPGYNAGSGVEGRALLWYGSADGMRGTSKWDDTGSEAAGLFGYSVSTAGDVNGDGFSDIIVGAPGIDGDTGAAYVYHGGPDGPSEEIGFPKRSNQEDADFGASVASAGDFNGDGYSDIVAGAPLYDFGKIDEGMVWIYRGSEDGPVSDPAWSKPSNMDYAHFGASVASAGDVNRDGYDDIIVGSPNWTSTHDQEGAIFVYRGTPNFLNEAPFWKADAAMTGAHFGTAAAGAGDVNCDGFADLIVGAPDLDWDFDGEQRGGAFVYFGAAAAGAIDHFWDWYAIGEDEQDHLGFSVASAGDVNGDGCSDVVVGIPGFEDDTNYSEGRAEVYLGSRSGLSWTPSWHAESNNFNAQMGFSVASAGDVNGDGLSEVIVGAPYYSDDPGISSEGKVWVFRGSPSGVTNAGSWSRESGEDTTYYGYSVASAGDVNGDGYADVIIGAPFDSAGVSDEGTARVYLGSGLGLGSGTYVWRGRGEQVRAWYGRSVATAGDVNGDGFADILVGVPKYTGAFSEEGRILLYFGGGGRGVSMHPHQTDFDGNPLPHLGASKDKTFFIAHLRRYSPFGRDSVKLQVEAKPYGLPFDGYGVWKTAHFTETEPPGDSGFHLSFDPIINQSHWRIRWGYQPLTNPFMPNSRWFHMPFHGWNEPDVRSSGSSIFLPVVRR